MENLSLFYRMLNEDLSPLLKPTNRSHIDFLKTRYPEYIKQLKIRIGKHKDEYVIKNTWKVSFPNILETIIPSKSEDEMDLINFALNAQGYTGDQVVSYAISNSDDWVDVEITLSEDYDSLPENEGWYHYYRVMLEEAVRDIRQHLHDQVFATRSEKEIRVQIRNSQALTGSYMKTILHNFIPRDQWNNLYQYSDDYSVIDIYKLIYASLEELLVFIEKLFGRYLDLELSIPYQSRLLFAIEYAEKLGVVLTSLEEIELDDRLKEIVMIPFENLGKLKPLSFSYREQVYHEAYLMAFYQAVQEQPLDRNRVLIILWRINFNALKYFNYITQNIKEKLLAKESTEERLELLYYYQKLCNQLLVKSKQNYNPQLPSLKSQIRSWIREEIGFQKTRLKAHKPVSGLHLQKNKRLLKMSVAQISLIARAFFETGLVQGSRKDFLRSLAETYRTDQQEDISIDSLSSKYYKVETGTKRSVGRMMKKMLAHIESAGKLA